MVFRFNQSAKSWRNCKTQNEYLSYVGGSLYVRPMFEDIIGKKISSLNFDIDTKVLYEFAIMLNIKIHDIEAALLSARDAKNILRCFGLFGRAVENSIKVAHYNNAYNITLEKLKDIPDTDNVKFIDGVNISDCGINSILHKNLLTEVIVPEMVSIYRDDFCKEKLKETIIYLFDSMIKPYFKTGKRKHTSKYEKVFMTYIKYRLNIAIANRDSSIFIFGVEEDKFDDYHIIELIDSHSEYIEDRNGAVKALIYIIDFCSRNIK